MGDAEDNCPRDANFNQDDADADGLGDPCDNCPAQENRDQADQDADGVGDACDVDDADGDGVIDSEDLCPQVFDDQTDDDLDGIGDACDNCPAAPNFSQADGDGDGIGDACELAGDDDADGVVDAQDNCPGVANRNQLDTDNDGRGDACDNCPEVGNFSQMDADADGVGDACEGLDSDGDGVDDGEDNCPADSNPAQTDTDRDGIGDACDEPVVMPPEGDLDVSLSWSVIDTDVDLHLLHPLGQWNDSVYDVHYANTNPAWAEPGLIQDALMPPGPEHISLMQAADGEYIVGVMFYSNNAGAASTDPSVTITCKGEVTRFGPQALVNAQTGDDGTDIWQVARVRLPSCEVIAIPAAQRVVTDDCGAFMECGQCDDCVQGVCRAANCPAGCDGLTGECADLCAGVRCNGDDVCEPRNGQCVGPAPVGCVFCDDNSDCPANQPTCRTNPLDASERYCTKACAPGCAEGFTCVGAQGDHFCEPIAGTCIDRCTGVECEADESCNAYDGLCHVGLFCANNFSCVEEGGTYCDMVDLRCIYPENNGAARPDEACGGDADCISGLICEEDLGQTCHQACDSDLDCNGQTCVTSPDVRRWYCASFGP